MFNTRGATSAVGGMADTLAPVPTPRTGPTPKSDAMIWGSSYLLGIDALGCTVDEALIARGRAREFRRQAPWLGTALGMVGSALLGAWLTRGRK